MKSPRCRQKKQYSDWLKRKFRKDIADDGYIFFYIIKVIKKFNEVFRYIDHLTEDI